MLKCAECIDSTWEYKREEDSATFELNSVLSECDST